MKKYKVLSSIPGRRGRMFVKGDEINENDIVANNANSLVQRGFLQEIGVTQGRIEGKIKLAIVTSVWERPEIVEMFAKGIINLLDKCPDFEIVKAVVSVSLADESKISGKSYMDTLLLHKEWGVILNNKNLRTSIIYIPNDPLAAKVNATTYACRDLGVDYVLCMGSDDIISPELLNEYAQYMRNGIDFIGVTDCYFYDTISDKSIYWGGYREPYRKGHTVGAFRALSARLLSQWDWMPWENKDSKVLDKSMQDKLKVTPHSIETFSIKEKGLFALDIKSATNMTPFALWDNSEYIDSKIIKEKFDYIF